MIWQNSLVIFLLLVLLGGLNVQADWRESFEAPKTVYLSEITQAPDSWLEVTVNIPLRFQSIREVFNPFFTPFNKEEYINFSAWDVHTPIWEKEGFFNEYPLFYISKSNKELQTFLKLKRFDTITVLAKVEGLFRGKPYFKVMWVCNKPGNLEVGNLSLMNRGMGAFKNREFDLAMGYFQRVFASDPPDDIKALLYKSSAQIFLYDKNSLSDALSEIKRGLQLAPEDAELHTLHRQCWYHMRHGGTPQPLKVRKQPSEAEKAKESAQAAKKVENGIENYQPVNPLESEPKPEESEELVVDDEIEIEEAFDYDEEIIVDEQ